MPEVGILDTSVLIDVHRVAGDRLPAQSAITAITLAELAAGPHAARGGSERSIRQERLQWAEATFDPLPFDTAAARSHGRVYAAVRAAQRQPPGRFADLLIASIAAANQLPLYTRNPSDFVGLDSLITVVAV